MNRARCLDYARDIVTKDRNAQYGEPEDNFGMIARFWSDYLKFDISSTDVGMMMCLFKIARLKSGNFGSEDSFVDLCGYAACAAECEEKIVDNTR